MRSQRGQYGLILALGLVPMIGFGALSLDLAMMSSMASQADAVAYAAAHTAAIAFKEGETKGDAEALAALVVKEHPSPFDGGEFSIVDLDWGYVDKSDGTHHVSGSVTEAVQVQVAREGADSVGTLLASVLGRNQIDVHGTAISDQIPSIFDSDGCDTSLDWEGDRIAITRADYNRVVPYDLSGVQVSGWYRLYKGNVAESGARQRNESSYFRVKNDANPEGRPLESESNCNGEFVVRDYDNGGLVETRVYLGTFYLDAESENVIEMRHYCAIQDQCPQYTDPYHDCGRTHDSIHFEKSELFCGDRKSVV